MDTSGNPWVVFPGDVPAEGYVPLTPEIESDPNGTGIVTLVNDRVVNVEQIIWSGYTNPNDVCDLKDGSDRDVFFRQGVSDFSDVVTNFGSRVRIAGLRVYTLTSGQLSIFVR